MTKADHQLLHQSNSNEWYTPARYVQAARDVMGGIDLDPASCAQANEVVKAARYFTIDTDGLAHDWPGRVWLNPPYGRIAGKSSAAAWSGKLIGQYLAGITTQAILLVNACPGDRWFMPLFAWPICFTDHRIRFYNSQGVARQPTKGNAFVYFGDRVGRFRSVFGRFGAVVMKAAS